MLKELVEKARKLELEGRLPPTGYTFYADPIKWLVHIYPEENMRIYIEEYAGENLSRPSISNRTSNVYSYPVADEACYSLGLNIMKGDKLDDRAEIKHESFLNLLEEILKSDTVSDKLVCEAIRSLLVLLRNGAIQKEFEEKLLFSKDWIAFVYEKDHLRGKHLYSIAEIKRYWINKISEDVLYKEKEICSICGRNSESVTNMPTKVNLLGSRRQIASYNENSFVSYRYSKDGAPLGICLSCAEESAQAMGELIKSSYNIYLDKNASGKINSDSTRNQIAIYWLKEDVEFTVDSTVFNMQDLISMPIALGKIPVETTHKLIESFLRIPWSRSDSSLNLDENKFYLAVLSPNVGRIVVRDWILVSAGRLKENLVKYYEALKLVDSFNNDNRPYSIPDLVEPLGETDPNIIKGLIRTAYLGEMPPFSLYQAAIRRLRITGARDGGLMEGKKNRKYGLEPLEVWQRQCTVIKFFLTYGKEGAKRMERLDQTRKDPAYQTGRLLAVLEEVQRRSSSSTLTATIVDRYYGSASTSPFTVLPSLISMATKAHMPKIRKKNRGYAELEMLLEEITVKINEAGGFPKTLLLSQQGEFALGFYHQRAQINSRKKNENQNHKESDK